MKEFSGKRSNTCSQSAIGMRKTVHKDQGVQDMRMRWLYLQLRWVIGNAWKDGQ